MINITWASAHIAANMSNWAVLDTITLSDHFYVRFSLQHLSRSSVSAPNARKQRAPTLSTFLSTSQLLVDSNNSNVDQMASDLSSALCATCSLSLPIAGGNKRNIHWWSPSLGTLRKTTSHLCHVFLRKR